MAPTFGKQERLVSRKLIERLFGGGCSLSMVAFPVRIVVMQQERQPADEPVQVLVSVSKRHFRHAVDRNRAKRQLREAYRHHKQLLADALPAGQRLSVALVWLAPQHYPSAVVDARVARLLRRISEKL